MIRKLASFGITTCILLSSLSVMLFAETGIEDYADDCIASLTSENSGISYEKYSLTSGATFSACTVHTVSFHPDDGYIAMPFAGYAGTSGDLETQYQCALGNRFGYEVAAVINGGFFGMSDPYGILRDINAYAGRLGSAHLPYTGNDIAFFSDGSIKPVSYTLHSTVEIGGKYYDDLVGCFNECRSMRNPGEWSTIDQLYYFDSLCGTSCDTCFPGIEILCNKTDRTELAIGYTLVGEVVSVRSDTYAGTIGKDQFILYYPGTSTKYTSLVQSVHAGDTIKISVKCSDAYADALLSEAIGIIPNIGWLVKDGVNRTYTESTIGTHSVTLYAGWTAFGWKDDGTVVFAVSESENPITMRDMAAKMLELGCRNVVRLDGGGSSAMYLADTGSGNAGYAYDQHRKVADCMLVLKRSSAADPELKNALGMKIAQSEAFAEYLPTEYAKAKRIYESPLSIDADYTHAIMGLSGHRAFDESVRWKKQPTDGKSFELEFTMPDCPYVDIRITSLKTGKVVHSERKAYSDCLRFENAAPYEWGNRFRVELIPGGDESRIHFVLYGDERNVVTFPIVPTGIIPGDLDGNLAVNSDDAVYLLYHTLLPDGYPVYQNVDYDGNGKVDSNDAIYLLYHTLLPEMHPLR